MGNKASREKLQLLQICSFGLRNSYIVLGKKRSRVLVDNSLKTLFQCSVMVQDPQSLRSC